MIRHSNTPCQRSRLVDAHQQRTGPGYGIASLSPRGLTLVETVIVLLIIGIVTAVGAPKMIDALSYHRVEAAAQRVRSDLRLARHEAQAQSESRTVEFSTATQSYTLYGVADPNRPGQTYRVKLGESPIMARLVTADFGGDEVLIFDGYGLPDTVGSVTVQVGRYTRTITIELDGAVIQGATVSVSP